MKDQAEIWDAWKNSVNMTATSLDRWLDTEESRSVGDTQSGATSSGKAKGGESTGHKSGRRIVEILGTRKADLLDADWEHMAKVVGYIKRHSSQRPKGDVKETHWRYSLMNWGHDPLEV